MTDLENRLRDAFAARAENVTTQSLRPAPPPTAPARNRIRWVFPTVGGLAVAATAAAFLVVSPPQPQSQAPAAPPTPTASPSSTPTPTGSPTPTTTPSTTSTPPVTLSPSPSAARTAVQAGWVRTAGAGWTARIPPGWRRSNPLTPVQDRRFACLGPSSDPCAVALGVTGDTSEYPDVEDVGTLIPPEDDNRCTVARRSSYRIGGDGYEVSRILFRCVTSSGGSPTSIVQLWPVRHYQVAVSRSPDDPVVKQVLASLDVEEGYDPPDTTVRQVNLPPATVTLPRTWKAETGVGVWCPPGAPRPCLEHGGLKIRADGPFSPRTFSGTPAGGDGDAFDPRSEGMGCLDEGDTGASPSRFVVLVDRAVTQGGQDGRYLEFRMTCTTGSHVHRRWYFPSARVMIDSGRASDAVDRIVRSLEFER